MVLANRGLRLLPDVVLLSIDFLNRIFCCFALSFLCFFFSGCVEKKKIDVGDCVLLLVLPVVLSLFFFCVVIEMDQLEKQLNSADH